MPTLKIQSYSIPCKAILFDKDGTLLDFMELWGQWAETLMGLLQDYLSSIGIVNRRLEALSTLLGISYDVNGRVVDYDRTGPLAMGTEEEITALLAWQLYSVGITWDKALKLVAKFSANALAEVKEHRPAKPIAGIDGLLKSCHSAGILLGVVTSDRTSEAQEHLEWVGLAPYFGSFVGRDRVNLGKPDPEMVTLACSELGISPADVIVIGDSNVDMSMGKEAGVMMTIGLEPGGNGASYLHDADILIKDYWSIVVET
ncbi:HAD family hydrolase [Paenibacillus segetis]|uniref:HAD family hydrolase n=1 Tax=Paenibacillus segetis TaxID=1325360 RepID=UPI001E2EE682|nr:HAD family hydrolase [Paenibacillus segetis]